MLSNKLIERAAFNWASFYKKRCTINNIGILEHLANAFKQGVYWERNSEKHIEELEKENAILRKALHLYVTWADECDVAWDNFPDMQEKWYKTVEEKGLGWIDGLVFMTTEEAKEQLKNAQEL